MKKIVTGKNHDTNAVIFRSSQVQFSENFEILKEVIIMYIFSQFSQDMFFDSSSAILGVAFTHTTSKNG